MFQVIGKITKRILSGDIPADSIHSSRSQPEPSPKAIKRAAGRGLGNGANRDGTKKR